MTDEIKLNFEPRGYRGIRQDLCEKYNVLTGITEDGEEYSRVYPYKHKPKVRILPKDFSQNKGFTNNYLLGMDFFNAGTSKKLTIVEGEDDWLSAIQLLGDKWPVVALPGAGTVRNVLKNPECYNYLKAFEKIVIATDGDSSGDEAANALFKAFPAKCYRVSMTLHKDANDYLTNDAASDFLYAWTNAQKFTPDNVFNTPDQFISLFKDAPQHQYVPTGIHALDEKILGLMQGQFTVIKAPTGIGKSLAPDTPVLKYSGEVVRADQVEVGDKLMGPDSTPRNVTNVNLQRGPMYKVTPKKGDVWYCNSDHILSLRHTQTGEVKNVIITEYLGWSKTQKHLWKQWRTGVDFPMCGPNQPSLAYSVGAYLGDGREQGPEICMGKKKEVVFQKMINDGHLEPTRIKFDRGAYYIGFSKFSHLWDLLSNETGQSENCLSPRKMPDYMKRGHKDTRKAILAGLLDTDGSKTLGGAEITQKSEQLADDICFVARSLGLAAYKKIKVVKGCDYYRVTLSGDLSFLPTQRLKFDERKINKNVLNVGFEVEFVGEGEYRGIALDGDHLFLMGDFTVTHNTEFMRFLEYQMLQQGVPIASWHLEETKVRTLLGLVSYHLQDNVTRHDIIEEKGKEKEVLEAITDLTKDENFYQFFLEDHQGADELCEQIRYFSEVCGCKYVFFEPIQDVISSSSEEGKEQALADLSVRLSKLAASLGIGIVTIAHTNDQGEPKYCKMIGQRAGIIIDLQRDKSTEDPEENNTTYLKVEKNRPASMEGNAGAMLFDLSTFVMKEKSLPY